MPDLTLTDLVANRTMSASVAATLREAARLRRSFVVAAVPRLAGKTTVVQAILAEAPRGTAIRTVGDDGLAIERLAAEARGGYLVVPEISQHPVTPGYIWGKPVRRVFNALGQGTALAAALHAPGVDEAFAMISQANGVPDAEAAHVELFVYLRSLGDDWQAPTRRVVAAVHEITGVTRGRPRTRLLHRWDEGRDRFEDLREGD